MDFWELSVKELKSLISSGEATAQDVLESYLIRIEEQDPNIRAYIELFEPEARLAAARVDSLILRGEDPGILAGVPGGVKDNISIKGHALTGGSEILRGYIAPQDAKCIGDLKKAGAIFLGRTNMDEFAMGGSTETSAYWPTGNPWDPTRTPGGSSGGSAAAVAAGMAPWALGTDTGGSIRQPSAFCGLCGLKPTYGLVSNEGVAAYASSLDHVGPIARTVWDCALLLEAMKPGSSYRPGGLRKGLRGLKAAVPSQMIGEGISPGVREQFENALSVLSDLGADIEEISMPSLDWVVGAYYAIASVEASSNLSRYDGVRYGKRASRDSLDDMYSDTRGLLGAEVKRRILLGTFASLSENYQDYYVQAAKVRTKVIQEFQEAFEKYHVLLSPTAPTVAFSLGRQTSDITEVYAGDRLTIPANLAGIPALSVPCGFSNPEGESGELPCGLQIMGRRWDEGTVLGVGQAFEEALGDLVSSRVDAMRKNLSGLKECEPVG